MSDSSNPPNGSEDGPVGHGQPDGAVETPPEGVEDPVGASDAEAIPLPSAGVAPVWRPAPAAYGEGYYPTSQDPTGQHPTGQHPTGQYPSAPYPSGQYPNRPYPTGQYAGSQYPSGSYPPGQYPNRPYPTGQYAGSQYPSGPYPAAGQEMHTPPEGTWSQPPAWESGPGGYGPGGQGPGGWGGGAGGAPPYGTWPYHTFGGTAPGDQPKAPHNKRNKILLTAGTLAVVIAVVLGAGVGHLLWPGSASNAGTSTSNGSSSQGSAGSGLSPFAPGSSSGSGSTGGSATGAGAPSNVTAIAARVSPALVDINTNLSYQQEQAAGTGMVLTSSGEVLTNNHVIDGATSISATDVGNGKTYTANVVGYDRSGDIAVIKLVNASGLQTVSTTSSSPSVGQAVVGIGNAGGTGGSPSTAGGSITALNQSITASDEGGGNAENLTGLIETNAGIQSGDSGGPLVNTSSKVIGVDTAASQGSTASSSNQAYAIPITTALSVANQIVQGKGSSTVHIGATAFIGVSVASPGQSATGNGGGALGGGGFGAFGGGGSLGNGGSSSGSGSSSTSGAQIASVVSGSPADKAGLAVGDIITGLDGTAVSSPDDLTGLLEPHHPGDSVQLQWTDSSGQTQTSTVSLATGPPA